MSAIEPCSSLFPLPLLLVCFSSSGIGNGGLWRLARQVDIYIERGSIGTTFEGESEALDLWEGECGGLRFVGCVAERTRVESST